MDAALGGEITEGKLAFHLDRRRLDPRLVAFLDVHDLPLEAVVLAPAFVHAQEHLRPVARFRAASAAVDGDERAGLVVLAGEELLEFKVLQLRARAGELGGVLRVGSLLLRGVGFLLGEELQGFQVGHLPLQGDERPDAGAQRRHLLHLLLRLLLAVPEAGFGHERFEFAQARLFARQVKDTSADCPRGL